MHRLRWGVVIVLALAGCGGSDPSASSVVPSSPAETPVVTQSTSTLYEADFAVPLVFDLAGGWLLASEQPEFVSVSLDPDREAQLVWFFAPTELYDPVTAELEPVPEDPLTWFTNNPHVEVTGTGSTELAGTEAMYVDGVVTSVPGNSPCGPNCMSLIPPPSHEDRPVHFLEGDTFRAADLEISGQPIMVIILDTSEGYATFLPGAEAFLETVQLG
jgi:hypothetical protein